MDVNQIVTLVVQGGAVALLALVMLGGWRLAREWIPRFMDFLAGLSASQAAHTEKQAVTDAKVDALIAGQARLTAAVEKLGDVASAAITKAGDSAGTALGALGHVVMAEADQTRSALEAAERRITKAIHREQPSDSDNPPPPSRASSHTPATGVPAVRRPSFNG